MNRLKNKVAVVYGNGAVGGAIAKAFAGEGAKVFLAGLTTAKLKAIADEILFDGGAIETSRLDALNEQAVDAHMADVINKTGRIDISFNAIGIYQKDVGHIPLLDLSVEGFSLPIATYTQSHFITAKAAAKRMVKQGNGVILMHTANLSRISAPLAGGRGPAWAAMESLCRSFSVECGEHGVRVVCLFTTAIPETPIIDEAFKELYEAHAKTQGMPIEQFNAMVAGGTHRKRLTTLKELTNAAIFTASDEGSAITGTVVNLTAGMIA
jgi:NAD(P)-dependent dehydrogenase (short-subunit alcohol dehydrogenase family)